jgi:hypothetical protein
MKIANLLIGIGIGLLAVSLSSIGVPAIPPVLSLTIACGIYAAILATTVTALTIGYHRWRRERHIQRVEREASDTVLCLVQELKSDYNPDAIAAAQRLGEQRDMSAVPSLIAVLETCVDEQRPGWCDVAAAIADALAAIGDRRALAVLYRLETVRGIGLIPSIRNAIAIIEPQTSLLRPGGLGYEPPQILLRATRTGGLDDHALLLHPQE